MFKYFLTSIVFISFVIFSICAMEDDNNLKKHSPQQAFSLNIKEPAGINRLGMRCYEIVEILKNKKVYLDEKPTIIVPSFNEASILEMIFLNAKRISGNKKFPWLHLIEDSKIELKLVNPLNDSMPECKHYEEVIDRMQKNWARFSEGIYFKESRLVEEDTLIRFLALHLGYHHTEVNCTKEEMRYTEEERLKIKELNQLLALLRITAYDPSKDPSEGDKSPLKLTIHPAKLEEMVGTFGFEIKPAENL